MTELETAIEVMNETWKTALGAMHNATQAEAEVARLTFLEYADRYPSKVRGFAFESEYQYNDEGGYFVATSVYPIVTECTSVELTDDYELQDTLGSYNREALALLCGVMEDAFEGECSVERARERRF
jgi:hypothetical protein